ncbi:Ger(x)C family spore germination protein [Alteribacter keqinensis]|uniref:Ger(X)C family spore germination protein n=1 Tax=Alteribacter keqinensis TaxID=2483800 RepID=A0A3M7TVE0_9BACI|nr:Ger(x)C family spore germination protein [Alteribacter keqinensis]RNA69413.1 Ger(x)C family spore germination protein [Alteribacter keqinensis]
MTGQKAARAQTCRTAFFCTFLLLLTGCVEPYILDEVQIIHAIGYDYIDDHHIEGTISIPVYGGSEDIRSETISAVSRTTKDIRLYLDAQSSKPLQTGKVSSVLFDRQLSELGLMRIIDTYVRDPRIGMRIQLAVVEEMSTKKLLETTYPMEVDVALYVSDLIEQNINQQNLPRMNFHIFLTNFYGQGRDPFLPILRSEGNAIKVAGLALLKGDRYVGQLNLKDCFLLKVLIEDFGDGSYEVILGPDENEYAMLRNIDSSTSYEITDATTNNPKIHATVSLSGKISEYSGSKLDQKKVDEIHKKAKKQLEQRIKKMLNRMQELNVDPMGIGDQVRRYNPDFSDDRWEEQFPNAAIDVDVNITIKETGVEE